MAITVYAVTVYAITVYCNQFCCSTACKPVLLDACANMQVRVSEHTYTQARAYTAACVCICLPNMKGHQTCIHTYPCTCMYRLRMPFHTPRYTACFGCLVILGRQVQS